MADTITTKKITELDESTGVTEENLFAVGDETTGALYKVSRKNVQGAINGNTDISDIGDGTVTGAIKAVQYAVVAPD